MQATQQVRSKSPRAVRIGLIVWFSLMAGLGLAGCAKQHALLASPVISIYRDPNLENLGVRRVVFLPTENETRHSKAGPRLREQLAAELKHTGLFQVIAPPAEAFGDCDTHFVAEDGLPENLLVEMARRFNADGVLVSAVTDYHPYSPPRVGMTVHLISTRDAQTLVTVDGIWDARDAAVTAYAQQVSRSLTTASGAEISPRLIIDTPAYFELLVARQIAVAFRPPLPPAVETNAGHGRTIADHFGALRGAIRGRHRR